MPDIRIARQELQSGTIGADPYAVVFAWLSTFASIGILAMQILVCLAVFIYFWQVPRSVGRFSRLIAPSASLIGLGLCLGLMVANLSLVSGSESRIIDILPIIVASLRIAGLLLAVWMRQARPAIYANLGQSLT